MGGEPGFADACEMGRQFQQVAIYCVMGDELFVSCCDAPRKLDPVGFFRERLASGK